MKSVLLLALIASLLIAQTLAGSYCNPTPENNYCYSELSQLAESAAAIPATCFVPSDALNGCVFNCEWFVRTARRNDPSKPCTLQRGRNGKFRSDCVQEQVCTKCKKSLVMMKQAFYLQSDDTAPRCPNFPEDLDAFTTTQLSVARDICRQSGECTCVSGDISPQVLSVRE